MNDPSTHTLNPPGFEDWPAEARDHVASLEYAIRAARLEAVDRDRLSRGTPWRERVEIGTSVLYLADFRDLADAGVFSDLTGHSAIITDPPYSSGGFQDAGKGSGSIGSQVEHSIAGDTYSTRGYLRLMRALGQAFGACSEAYLFTDWRMWIYTFDALEEAGFRVRNMLTWNKGNGGMGIKWRNQHELIAWGARGTMGAGWGTGNVLDFPRTGNKHHPTEKPVPLLAHLIASAGRGTVVDPFAGSGGTGVACAQLGNRFRFIGCEVDPVHFRTGCDRVEKAHAQGAMCREHDTTSAEQSALQLPDPDAAA